MKRIVIATIAAASLIAGCASTSTPLSVGQGRYMLTGQGGWDWNGGAVIEDLIKQGAAFCAQQGGSFELLSSKSEDAQSYPVARVATATIEFTCKK